MKPKLTLRDLFWLVLVVSVFTGVWRLERLARHQDEVRKTQEVRSVLEKSGLPSEWAEGLELVPTPQKKQ